MNVADTAPVIVHMQVCTCALEVTDVNSQLQSCTSEIALVAGEPVQIVLKSNIIGEGEEDIHGKHTRKVYTAKLPAVHKLEDLQARVVDSGNNIVPSPGNVHAIKSFNLPWFWVHL